MGDATEIDKLTDDCLIQIFQRLPTIVDKVRIERMCKRWQNVSQRSWNNFKYLDFSVNTWGIRESETPLIRSIDLDKIIRLSGRFLTSISTDVGKFARICHLLPNICQLQLLDDCVHYERKKCYLMGPGNQCTYDAWQIIHSWLVSHGENVTNLKMELYHTHYKEEDFVRFLGRMKQLKSFHLRKFPFRTWSGRFLLELPFETIEEIVLIGKFRERFNSRFFSVIIKKTEKLQTLGIDKMYELDTIQVLEVLPSQANNLKNLKMYSSARFRSQSLLLSTMSALTHLEKLDVDRCPFVNDAFLEVVGNNCKELTYLYIRACFEVTDRGISSIRHLEKLTYLNIQALTKVRNPPLEKLENLVVLDMAETPNIEEECLRSFLEKAQKLRALDISRCIFRTNKRLNLAIEVFKTRNSNNELDLYLYETEIDVNAVDEKPTFLNIISSGVMGNKYVKYGIEGPFLPISNPEVYTH